MERESESGRERASWGESVCVRDREQVREGESERESESGRERACWRESESERE